MALLVGRHEREGPPDFEGVPLIAVSLGADGLVHVCVGTELRKMLTRDAAVDLVAAISGTLDGILRDGNTRT